MHFSSSPDQIPGILDYPPAREFLSLNDPRGTFPLYDRETIDEQQGEATGDAAENRIDLGGTEKSTAQITDFKLLKVIGKGSFGKVTSPLISSSGVIDGSPILPHRCILAVTGTVVSASLSRFYRRKRL